MDVDQNQRVFHPPNIEHIFVSFSLTLVSCYDSLFWIFISSVIPGNRIQPDAHAESGSTWLTFNYNYGSLMPINWRMVSHYHRRWLHARHGVAFALNILLRLKKKKKNESLIQGKTSFRRTRKFRLSHCRLHVRVKKNFLFFFIFIRVPLSSHYTPSLFLSSFFFAVAVVLKWPFKEFSVYCAYEFYARWKWFKFDTFPRLWHITMKIYSTIEFNYSHGNWPKFVRVFQGI